MHENQDNIMKKIHDLEERVIKLEQSILNNNETDNRAGSQKKLSLRELFRKTKSKTNVEKVLLAGFYLEVYEGSICFNAEEIKNALRNAKIPPLSNTLAFINQNIKNGNIMQEKQKKDDLKAYTLTATGEDLVKNLIDELKS